MCIILIVSAISIVFNLWTLQSHQSSHCPRPPGAEPDSYDATDEKALAASAAEHCLAWLQEGGGQWGGHVTIYRNWISQFDSIRFIDFVHCSLLCSMYYSTRWRNKLYICANKWLLLYKHCSSLISALNRHLAWMRSLSCP